MIIEKFGDELGIFLAYALEVQVPENITLFSAGF